MSKSKTKTKNPLGRKKSLLEETKPLNFRIEESLFVEFKKIAEYYKSSDIDLMRKFIKAEKERIRIKEFKARNKK